jgi:hypothetical protein
MTRPINYNPDGEPTYKIPRRHHRDEPIYGKAWKTLKHFPQGLAAGSDLAPTVSGPAAAAFLSAEIGCFTIRSRLINICWESPPIKKKLPSAWTDGNFFEKLNILHSNGTSI